MKLKYHGITALLLLGAGAYALPVPVRYSFEIIPPKVSIGEVFEVRVLLENSGKKPIEGVSISVVPSYDSRNKFKSKIMFLEKSRPRNVPAGGRIVEAFPFWATEAGYGQFDVSMRYECSWGKSLDSGKDLVSDATQFILVVDPTKEVSDETDAGIGNSGVAVLGFESLTNDERAPELVSDMFRNELSILHVKIIERSQINGILGEMSLQQTGCTETECAIKLGRLVSARFIVMGGVGTILGRKYALVRVIDVESGVVIGSGKAGWRSKYEMVKSIRSTSRSISSMIGSK